MTTLDAKALRNTFGQFMTGVTVVTTTDKDGAPVGFTANSFSSVSLDPPLLLICLANNSNSFDTFTNASGFAVNILAEQQSEISNTFARPVDDRFAAVDWKLGPVGSPVLDGVCAWFDCTMEQQVPAGDHIILIGCVEAFENYERGGLGYASGGYFTRSLEAQAARLATVDEKARVAAVVTRGGELLLQGSESDGWSLANVHQLPNVSGGQRQRLSQAFNLALRDFFIYAVYDDPDTKTQHIVYRCVADEGEPAAGQFVPLEQLERIKLADAAEEILLRRYISESKLGNFKIYLGDKNTGEVTNN